MSELARRASWTAGSGRTAIEAASESSSTSVSTSTSDGRESLARTGAVPSTSMIAIAVANVGARPFATKRDMVE